MVMVGVKRMGNSMHTRKRGGGMRRLLKQLGIRR